MNGLIRMIAGLTADGLWVWLWSGYLAGSLLIGFYWRPGHRRTAPPSLPPASYAIGRPWRPGDPIPDGAVVIGRMLWQPYDPQQDHRETRLPTS